MRSVGFSTGALALGNLDRAFEILEGSEATAIEVSALRYSELLPTIERLPEIERLCRRFKHISFHAPSSIPTEAEEYAVTLLLQVARLGWPIVVHPDVIHSSSTWSRLGNHLCIENMDKRKPIGQTASDLFALFTRFPDATFCFDLGHARQVDPTMSESWRILKSFGNRLIQLHVSEVNSQSKHDPLTYEAILAFKRISHLIPEEVPIILESRVPPEAVNYEIEGALATLDPQSSLAHAGD